MGPVKRHWGRPGVNGVALGLGAAPGTWPRAETAVMKTRAGRRKHRMAESMGYDWRNVDLRGSEERIRPNLGTVPAEKN